MTADRSPAAAGVEVPGDMVILGKIVGPHGLQGAVRIHPFADDPQSWARLPQWWIGAEGDAPEVWRSTRLLRCRAQDKHLVAELECLPDRDASEAVRGLFVGVPRSGLPVAAENEYYWADLIGLEVRNTHEVSLGQVLGLIETAANDVLRVGDGVGKERLLPFVAAVVLDVDLVGRCLCVEWEADW